MLLLFLFVATATALDKAIVLKFGENSIRIENDADIEEEQNNLASSSIPDHFEPHTTNG